MLVHWRVDVRGLNDVVREALEAQGVLAQERVYATDSRQRVFAAGDRVVFLRIDPVLGVKNGTLATVEQTAPGTIAVQLDASGSGGAGRRVTVDLAACQAIDHGYATTIHKSQGRRWTGRSCWRRARWTGI